MPHRGQGSVLQTLAVSRYGQSLMTTHRWSSSMRALTTTTGSITEVVRMRQLNCVKSW